MLIVLGFFEFFVGFFGEKTARKKTRKRSIDRLNIMVAETSFTGEFGGTRHLN